jgi:phosphoglycolate phosphatase
MICNISILGEMYMKHENILFDLDGTLTDSAEGIINSVEYSLKRFGIVVHDRIKLYSFIGPPLAESFKLYYGFSDNDTRTAVKYYREYYREKGIYENKLYDGIDDLLLKLKKDNRTLAIATAKPEIFAKQVLEYFGITKYFTYIAGSSIKETGVKKEDVIQHALKGANINNHSKTVMVGDRKHDIIGAKRTGLKSIGVLYGYGSREELEKVGADYIVETVEELGSILGLA